MKPDLDETYVKLYEQHRSPIWIDKEGNYVPLAIISDRYLANIKSWLIGQVNQASALLLVSALHSYDDVYLDGPAPIDAEEAREMFFGPNIDTGKVAAHLKWAKNWLETIEEWQAGKWKYKPLRPWYQRIWDHISERMSPSEYTTGLDD